MKIVRESLYEGLKPLKMPPINSNLEMSKIERGGDTIYKFTEIVPKVDDDALTYTYSLKKGNVYMKRPMKYATSELRSNSHAFNKGNPDKMAIPNDVESAVKFINNHYEKYKRQ